MLGDDRGKDTSVFEVSGQGTTVSLSLSSLVPLPLALYKINCDPTSNLAFFVLIYSV